MARENQTLTTVEDLEMMTRAVAVANANDRTGVAGKWGLSWVAHVGVEGLAVVVPVEGEEEAAASVAEVEEAAVGVGRYHGTSPRPAKGAPDKIQKTMHEFKHGTLHSTSKQGPRVKSRKQAIAIALSQQRKANRGRRTKRASRRR